MKPLTLALPRTDVLDGATKACTKCGQYLPLEAFYRHKSRRDGRQAYCRECQKALTAARRAVARASGKCNECCVKPTADGYATCADCRERYAAYKASGKHAENLRRGYARRRDAGLCTQRGCHDRAVDGRGGYCARHADERNAKNARHQKRKRKAWLDDLDRRGTGLTECVYAGIPNLGPCGGSTEQDHAWPRSRGGPDVFANLVPVCSYHNVIKLDRCPDEFLERHGVEIPWHLFRVEFLPLPEEE